MYSIISLIDEVGSITPVDYLFNVADGTLATLISIGYGISIFAFGESIRRYDSVVTGKLFLDMNTIHEATPIVEKMFILRNFYAYRNLQALASFMKLLAGFFFIAAASLTLSFLWDQGNLGAFYYTDSYRISYKILHEVAGFFTTLAYLLLLIFYLIWLVKKPETNMDDYVQKLVYYLRRFIGRI